MKVQVYPTYNSVEEKILKGRIVVVVDVLRASSTIITALYNGCKEIIPVIEIEEAMNMARNYEKDTILLGGERNAQKIEGFHLSNSPSEYTREVVQGRGIIITTTNGTTAIKKASEAKEVIIAGFLNIDVVSDYIKNLEEDVIFLCAGTEGRFSLDDIVAAGAIISRVRSMGCDIEPDDLAMVCEYLYENHKQDVKGILKNTYHYRKLTMAGMDRDIDDCLRLNAAPVVPVYRDGVIRRQSDLT